MMEEIESKNLQIWTQREMLSAVFAGIVIGFAIATIFMGK